MEKDEEITGDEDLYEFTEADEELLKMDPDEQYELYRDHWSESLLSDVKALFTEYVKDTRGYYFGADERFVEHTILCLAETAKVQLLPELGGHIRAKKYQAPRVEFVESFDELKPKEVEKSDEVQIKPGA
jgi:hypothetical protein